MREHALDGEMRLAGVGRAEHGGDAGAARTRIAGRMEKRTKWAFKSPKTVRQSDDDANDHFGVFRSRLPAAADDCLAYSDAMRNHACGTSHPR